MMSRWVYPHAHQAKRSGAPEGRDMIAQGIALGRGGDPSSVLSPGGEA
jgi:hypothetical protein